MFDKEKYHGEIWFPDKYDERCFCILFYKDGKVFLETNLGVSEKVYVSKHLKILGLFTRLGHVTFIDCKLSNTSSGIITSYVYESRYTFTHSGDFFIPEMTTNKFSISNNGLLDWRMWGFDFDPKQQTINYGREEPHTFKIVQSRLEVEMIFFTSFSLKKNCVMAQNYAKVILNYEDNVTVGKAIDDYHTFQKLVQFLTGNATLFNSFSYLCPSTNKWGYIRFEGNIYKEMNSVYLVIDFNDIYQHLPTLVKLLYTDANFLFCINKILDNHTDGKISHSKRFTNSISTFEGFCKLYSGRTNTKLNFFFDEHKNLIREIMNIDESNFKDFTAKIVRSRSYHVHANINDHRSNNIFSDFELLYISFALGIIVAIGLLKQANVSPDVLDKIIDQGKMTFSGLQNLNRELRTDSIRDYSSP
ncbi:HEPN domain-containing protein [Sphingobacterium faecium]|uniref:ApeA N-terminal domain 1-containing protein n=1 Tax=Sphingobacterium faecium TaxID=34087 RepID=UPI003DA21E9D